MREERRSIRVHHRSESKNCSGQRCLQAQRERSFLASGYTERFGKSLGLQARSSLLFTRTGHPRWPGHRAALPPSPGTHASSPLSAFPAPSAQCIVLLTGFVAMLLKRTLKSRDREWPVKHHISGPLSPLHCPSPQALSLAGPQWDRV